MIAGQNSEDYSPLTWIGRFPIYLTTALVGVHSLAFIAVALLMGFGGGAMVQSLTFSSERVLQDFSVWQFVTYAFVNDPRRAIWFLLEMYLLLMFGREVEKFLGRRAFIWLYSALILVAPTFLIAGAMVGIPSVYAGSGAIHFAIFVAFAVIYPSAQIFFGFQAKWVVLVLLVVYSLQYVAFAAWMPVLVLWLDCACAYGMMRARGVGGFGLPFETWEPRSEEPPPRRMFRRTVRPSKEEEDPYASIDPLLEKISKSGIGSLTKRERERLEKAREALLDREKNPR